MTQWKSYNSGVNKNQTGALTWNANGTLKTLAITDSYSATDNNLNCAFGYDDLTRLISSNCSPTWAQTFSYDVFGNITKSGNVNYNPGYNSNNRALSSTYDSAGNTLNDGSNAYAYDARNRPATVSGVQVMYDAFGRTVEYNNSGTYTQWVYDPQGEKLAGMTGQSLRFYLLPLAGGVKAVFNGGGLWFYRHSDWLGSSRLGLDTSGNLYSGKAFAPFGESYAEAGLADRSFTGQTQDVVKGPTAIYDFMFRQHSAAQGRWLVPDPAGVAAADPTNPQTWNRYAYVGNNPLSFIDPLGLACKRGNRGAVQMGGCNMPGLGGGDGDVSIDIGSPIPIGLFGDGGAFGPGLGGGDSAVPCLPGDCANTVADAAGNVFKDQYSNTLDLNCTGENLHNYQCSWSHWSRWFVYNGNQTYYYGGVQQLLNANADTWRNASGAANTAAIGTLMVGGGATGTIAYEEAPVLFNTLFGRVVPGSTGINSGLLNSNPFLRIGLGWQEGVGDVFRISIGSGASTIHLLNQPWPFQINSWPPSIVP